MPPTVPHRLSLLLGALLASVLTVGPAAPAHAAPIEDYASYVGGTACKPKPKPGAVALGRWIVDRFGGGFGGVGRACSSSTSEHEEGRAFDWTLDAARKADRQRASKLLRRVFAIDGAGNEHALARRMGIMYVIWNDSMWASYDRFERERYLSSSCPSRRRCSTTLRHRDHLHVSLSRPGGRGATSWYDGRLG